ncbi:hypothetical protein IFM89_011892 [Coptis chinensis]|uniref:TF-B3 domain-containing protein n=1 Tax=Coptis chinensis TaxID=261450 RepID=A0A835I1J7_9MAGN|nr:hypothetical protein IFM89_011892 [Coptis chinensis]
MFQLTLERKRKSNFVSQAIPKKFVMKLGKELPSTVVLKVRNTKEWRVGLREEGGKFWLQRGWNAFVKDNSIRPWYSLVFRNDGNYWFNVVICDKTGSEVEYPCDIIDLEEPSSEIGFQTSFDLENEEDCIEILDIPATEQVIECNDPMEIWTLYTKGLPPSDYSLQSIARKRAETNFDSALGCHQQRKRSLSPSKSPGGPVISKTMEKNDTGKRRKIFSGNENNGNAWEGNKAQFMNDTYSKDGLFDVHFTKKIECEQEFYPCVHYMHRPREFFDNIETDTIIMQEECDVFGAIFNRVPGRGSLNSDCPKLNEFTIAFPPNLTAMMRSGGGPLQMENMESRQESSSSCISRGGESNGVGTSKNNCVGLELHCSKQESRTSGSLIRRLKHQTGLESVTKRPVLVCEKERAIVAATEFTSENPFCIVVMRSSYVSGNFILNLPLRFAIKYLKNDLRSVTLRVSDKRRWQVRCSIKNYGVTLGKGWRVFVLDNHLEEHDVCIFELVDKKHKELKVGIFRCLQDPKHDKGIAAESNATSFNPSYSVRNKQNEIEVTGTKRKLYDTTHCTRQETRPRVVSSLPEKKKDEPANRKIDPRNYARNLQGETSSLDKSEELSLEGACQVPEKDEMEEDSVEIMDDFEGQQTSKRRNRGANGRFIVGSSTIRRRKPTSGKDSLFEKQRRSTTSSERPKFWHDQTLSKYETHLDQRETGEISRRKTFIQCEQDQSDISMESEDEVISVYSDTESEGMVNSRVASVRSRDDMVDDNNGRKLADQEVESDLELKCGSEEFLDPQGNEFKPENPFYRRKTRPRVSLSLPEKQQDEPVPKSTRRLSVQNRERATKAAREFTSEYPFCSVIMRASYGLPTSFVKKHLEKEVQHLTLQVSDGRTWPVSGSFYNQYYLVTKGWKEFVSDNHLDPKQKTRISAQPKSQIYKSSCLVRRKGKQNEDAGEILDSKEKNGSELIGNEEGHFMVDANDEDDLLNSNYQCCRSSSLVRKEGKGNEDAGNERLFDSMEENSFKHIAKGENHFLVDKNDEVDLLSFGCLYTSEPIISTSLEFTSDWIDDEIWDFTDIFDKEQEGGALGLYYPDNHEPTMSLDSPTPIRAISDNPHPFINTRNPLESFSSFPYRVQFNENNIKMSETAENDSYQALTQ